MKFSGLKEYVYHELKKMLISNVIKPGERIYEINIAEKLEVSRTPVREAINQLVAEGFVENRPRKGVFAAEISKDELIKMLDVRIALESLAIKLCCENIKDDEIKELRDILKNLEERLRNKNYIEDNQWDSKIHRFIAEIADNKKLGSYINDIQDVFAYTRVHNIKWTEEKIERSIEEHKKIVEAISSRNEKDAIKIIKKDIDSMREFLIENDSAINEVK